jgi:hypothetical protein
MTQRDIPPGRIYLVALAALVLTGAALVLFFYDPATTRGLYPLCFLHQTTGLQCPGCGTLRALHQLSHGHIAAAFALNPLTVSLLPVALWLVVRQLFYLTLGWRLPGLVTRPIFGWALIAVMVVFGVLRNLPAFKNYL